MIPTTYPKEEHKIDVNHIDDDALYILKTLRSAHYTAYLVGGGVRDLLLRQKPKDFDISTSAKPEEIKNLFPGAILIGKRFRLAHVRFGRKVIEVSTFRAGDIENERFITEDNIWGDPEQDVLRRDFTINGLFYDSEKQQVIDYVGGYLDIQKKYLRAIGHPYLRFKQDPVRMIRCLKFQARYGFEVDKKTKQALIDCKKEIVKSAWARILEELLRMLESGSAQSFFKLITKHGLLEELIPILAQFLETPKGSATYDYLQIADQLVKRADHPQLKRPILLCCLTFPLLENELRTRFQFHKRVPHLGEIYQRADQLLDEMFASFFRLPRRLKITTLNTLVWQYRMTPLRRRKHKISRIPQVDDFEPALQFLHIRARMEPLLEHAVSEWTDLFNSSDRLYQAPTWRRRRKQRIRKKP